MSLSRKQFDTLASAGWTVAAYVTDADIAATAQQYAAPGNRPFSTAGGEAA
jgi:hypothetical protein